MTYHERALRIEDAAMLYNALRFLASGVLGFELSSLPKLLLPSHNMSDANTQAAGQISNE